MVNRKAFLEARELDSLTLQEVSERMGLTTKTLDMKLRNVTEFLVSEMEILCEICGLSTRIEKDRIFFYALAL